MDIEINDEPVEDFHMKLGEAGEAFFVQAAEIESEVSYPFCYNSVLNFDPKVWFLIPNLLLHTL